MRFSFHLFIHSFIHLFIRCIRDYSYYPNPNPNPNPRYVTVKKNDEGRQSSFHIQESFLGFTEVESQKGQDLAFLITKENESVTDLQKIRGQGCDGAGAVNMSGAYKGVQTLMKQNRYIHCMLML